MRVLRFKKIQLSLLFLLVLTISLFLIYDNFSPKDSQGQNEFDNIIFFESGTNNPINFNKRSDNTLSNVIDIQIGTSKSYATLDEVQSKSINPKETPTLVTDKNLKQKIEKTTNRIVNDFVWVETNSFIPEDTGGKIILSSIGQKTFKCDGTVDNPDCFEISACSISQKPCYEFDNGKTIVYVNHFSGAFNTMTWTTDADWNTGTHANTTSSSNDLILYGTNTTGTYLSNKTDTIDIITRIKPIWNSTEQDINKNITVEISADNGTTWLTATNNTNYTAGAGIGTGHGLVFRINFSTNDSSISPELHDITFEYDTDEIACNIICSGGGSLSDTCYINNQQTVSSCIINGSNLVLQSGGDITASAGNSFTINLSENITIDSGGKITGNVKLTATNLIIEKGGEINLNGKGYSSQNGPGNGTTLLSGSPLLGGGACYGGAGGNGYGLTNTCNAYGSMTEPTDLGSGGGTSLIGGTGGYGGGKAFINITNTLIINGSITADGEYALGATWGGGGGSGGSIYIITNNLEGNGSITANGGLGGDGSSLDGGGGAGGRVAIYYITKTYTGNTTVNGAWGYQLGEPGTLVFNGEESISCDSGDKFNTCYIKSIHIYYENRHENKTFDFNNMVITSTGSFVLPLTEILTLNLSGYIDIAGSIDSNVNITATNLTIESSGQINANQKGYSSQNGLGTGISLAGLGDLDKGAGGACYGGKGGNGYSKTNNCNFYGFMKEPTDFGSGGGKGRDYAGGGSGGGKVFLNITDNLIVNGPITANGVEGTIHLRGCGGGGSGGSVYLITNNLEGNGLITANGGAGGDSQEDGGGGAGGRIAIYSPTKTHDGNITANGAWGYQYGQNGSIYLEYYTISINLNDTDWILNQNQSLLLYGTVSSIVEMQNATFNQTNVTLITEGNISIYINGIFEDKVPINSTGGYNYSFTAPQTAGNHTVKVNLTNLNEITVKNTKNLQVLINLTNQSSLGNITGKTNINQNENVSLSVTILSENINSPTLNLSRVWANITWNNGSELVFFTGAETGGDWIGTFTTTSVLDTYTVTYYANLTDSFAIITNTTSNFTTDTIGLVITIQSPENITYNTSSIWFNVTLDKDGDWCGYELDNTPNVTLSNDTQTHFYNINSTMIDAIHNVIFYCNDSLGNLNSTTITFTVDTTVPILTFAPPTEDNDAYINKDYTYINWTLDETNPDTTIINWNGTNFTTTNTYYNITGIINATYTYYVWANDTAGGSNQTEIRTITIDTTPPIIIINSPTNTNYLTKEIQLNIDASDSTSPVIECLYSLDGNTDLQIPKDTGTIYKKLLFNLDTGFHNITFTCTNAANLSTKETIYFNITTASVLIKLTGTGFLPVLNQDDNYIASELPQGTVTGLVHAEGDFKEVSEDNGMSLTNSIGSITYLVYTQGTTDDIKDRTEHIRSGEFDKMPNPSFGYPIKTKYKIYVGLDYEGIDIEGNELLRDGFYELTFEKTGKLGNKNIVSILLK